MKTRTSNIILICKGRHNWGTISKLDAVKKYLAIVCNEPISDVTLTKHISEAVLDYLSTATEYIPFMEAYFKAVNELSYSEIISWIYALTTTNVYNTKLQYINGFTEDNTRYIKNEDTGEPMAGI